MSAAAVVEAWFPRPESHREWPELSVRAPQLVSTMRRYLLQLTTFLAPRSVDVADSTLRQFARWLVATTDVAVASSTTSTCWSVRNPAVAWSRSMRNWASVVE